jgi:hypothetical protein
MRKSRIEYKWSGLAQRADLTADMLNRQQRANGRLLSIRVRQTRCQTRSNNPGKCQ